jgi:hypothetical protein
MGLLLGKPAFEFANAFIQFRNGVVGHRSVHRFIEVFVVL